MARERVDFTEFHLLQVSVDQALQRLDGIVEAGKVIEEKKSGVTVLRKISVFREMFGLRIVWYLSKAFQGG